MKKTILISLLLGLLALAGAVTELGREFEGKVRQTQSPQAALPLIMEYLPQLSDLEDLRVLQNYWMEADKPACRSHFEQAHQANPGDANLHYLWLRVLDDNLQQYREAKLLIAANPDFYWGYRIFCNSYIQIRSLPQSSPEIGGELQDNSAADLAILMVADQRYSGDEYVNLALFHYHWANKAYPQAEARLLRMQTPQAIETHFNSIMDFVVESKQLRAFETLFPILISSAVASKDIDAADSLAIYQYNYVKMLIAAELWGQLNTYFDANPDLKTNDQTLADRIAMHIGLQNYETALNLLEGALAKSVLRYPTVVADAKYAPLRELPRWGEVMANAASNHAREMAELRAKTIAKRLDKPAPLWELPDAAGMPVRLQDLRGKVVFLDFWATWCSPCLRTMPLLDAWTRKNVADDVVVISINTWDSSKSVEEIVAFMEDNDYSMRLLFGNNELPKAYGFTGIPHICVINKEGKIAFEHSGYSQDLPDLLDIWLEELRN